jgi:hypothetical protein
MYGGPPAIASIYYNYQNGPPPMRPGSADREAMEKSTILNLIAAPGYYGYTPTMIPMVVAWTAQPAERIEVAGGQSRSTALTAVVLPLAIGGIGPGQLPAGLVVSRFTDIEGTTMNGPPGAVVMQNGSATYSFTPRLAPGARLTAAALDSTNQNVKGGYTGTSQSILAEVWDWSGSKWVSFNYSSAASTAIPSAAIDPSSGEVRVRLTTNGGTGGNPTLFASLSLTGMVE